jgi:SAM-dependent methyltransferase
MRTREHRELFRLEDIYWWFVGRRELVRQIVTRFARPGRQIIFDAGCGTGGTLSRLTGLGALIGCDTSEFALRLCHERGLQQLVAASVQALPFAADSFSAVLSCDVLEHVTDDRQALQEMTRVLQPGGILVLTVPAHPFLWSEHDEALSHQRRYTAKGLRQLLEGNGTPIEKLSPVVSGAFLPILLFRLLQKLRPRAPEEPRTDLRILPAFLNNWLITILRLENWLLKSFNLPVGTSLVAVARKPEQSS